MDLEERKLLKRIGKAKDAGKLDDLGLWYRRLGEIKASAGNYEGALTAFQEELSVLEIANDTAGVAAAHRMVGEMLSTLGRFGEALEHVNRYLMHSRTVKDAVEEQRALATVGRTYFCWASELKQAADAPNEDKVKAMEILKECRTAYKKSLYICEEKLQNIGNRERQEMKARILYNLGLACEIEDDIKAAIEYISKATQICKQENLMEDLYRCFTSQSGLLLRQGLASDSLLAIDQAIEVAKKVPNSSELSVFALLQKGETYFSIGNFNCARNTLKIARKIRSPIEEDRKAVELSLKRAVKICRLEQKLASIDENMLVERKKLFEKLGDAYCTVKNFNLAIQSYLNMLNCGVTLGLPDKDLQPCYVSLFRTYIDNKQYELALEYANKDLAISQSIPSEAAKSHITIGEILELQGKDYNQVAVEYREAHRLAKLAHDVKLQASALKRLLNVQRADCRAEEAVLTESMLNGLGDNLSSSESDSDASDSDVNLSDLSDDDDTRARPIRQQTFKVTRNEKGETPLHVAAIKGDVARVKRLISIGHPLKERDQAGWTPLHEAANHGHIEVVRTLLEAGADVNDPGGSGTAGVTPLHDAATNGHFEVVEAFLEHNASVTVLTDDGETPLDSLKGWRSRVMDGGLTVAEEIKYEELVNKFESKLRALGYQSQPNKAKRNDDKHQISQGRNQESNYLKPSSRYMRKKPVSPVRNNLSIRNSLDLDSPPRSQEYSERNEKEPVSDYRSAMQGLRRRSVALDMPHQPKPKHHGPLLDESSYVEEWLEDDLRVRKRKKGRTDSGTSANHPIHESDHSFFPLDDPDYLDDVVDVDDQNSKRRKLQSTLLDAGFQVKPTTPQMNQPDSSVELLLGPPVPSVFPSMPSPPLSSVSDYNIQAVTKVKVKVGSLTLLVPLDSSKVDGLSVKWLAEDVARRYWEIEGTEPVLQLKTKDGAILGGADPLNVVIGEELETNINGWKTVNFSQRYRNAVAAAESTSSHSISSYYYSFAKGPDVAIIERLTESESSGELDLSYMALSAHQLRPVFQALRHEKELKSLNLAGNAMGDPGLEDLVNSLQSCSLQQLSIRCNNITSNGISNLIEKLAVSSNSSILRLDVSSNFIGQNAEDLASRISKTLPNLLEIKTDNCERDMNKFKA